MTNYYNNFYNFIENSVYRPKSLKGEKDTDNYVASGEVLNEKDGNKKIILNVVDKDGGSNKVTIDLPKYLLSDDLVNNPIIEKNIIKEINKLDNKFSTIEKLNELTEKVNSIHFDESDPVWNKEKNSYLTKKDADATFLKEHQSLDSYAKKTEIPTSVSQLTNDSGYLTEHQDLTNYAKKVELPKNVSELKNDSGYLTEHQSLVSYAKKTEIPTNVSQLTNDSGYLTEHQSLDDYALKSDIPKNISSLTNDRNYLTEHQDLSDYAKRLELKPLITSEKANKTFVKNIELEYEKSDGSLSVVVDGEKKTVTLPMDKFIKAVKLDDGKKHIVFVFNNKEEDTIKLPTTDLFTSYIGGDGIRVVDTTISLDPNKINNYLTKVDAEKQYLKIIDKPEVPTRVSELENDKGYLTKHQSLESYLKKSELPNNISHFENDSGYIDKSALTPYLKKTDAPKNVSAFVNDSGYLTEHQSLEDYALKSELPKNISELNNDAKYLTQHQDLSDYAKKVEIPTNVSQLANDSGYLTEHQSLDSYAKKIEIPTNVSQLTNDSGYLTEHQSLDSYALKSDIPAQVSVFENDSNYVNIEKLKTELDKLTIKTERVSGNNITKEIEPNKFYIFEKVNTLNLTLKHPEDDNRYNEYMIEFISGDNTRLILPNQIRWIGSNKIERNRKYHLSIVNNVAVMGNANL